MPTSRNKRRNAKTRKPAARRTSRKAEPGPPPFRSMESLLSSMRDGQDFDDPASQAQTLVYDAWEATRARDRINLARKALKLWPDCADALNILAEETARSAEEAVALYREALAAGERALGERSFREGIGHFWGLLETRPYMRARAALAQSLEVLGQTDESVDHYRGMLKLNPSDNQGIRYCLLRLLLKLDRNEEAGQLINDYSGDGMAEWLYGRALLLFRQEGDSKAARDMLAAALEANRHVPDYLLGRRRLPAAGPDYIQVGSASEAQAFAADYKAIWHGDRAALDWLKHQTMNNARG